jgi:hypothetical protein
LLHEALKRDTERDKQAKYLKMWHDDAENDSSELETLI